MKFKRKWIKNIILYLLAVLGAVFVIEYPPRLIPEDPSLKNFIEAWTSNYFQLYFRNSAFVAILSTIGTVLFSAMTAYAFARFDFKGKEVIFTIMMLVLMVPDIISIIPRFYIAKTLGLRNSLWGLIVFYIAGSVPLNTFMLRGFFEAQPRELEDAMTIDGAGPFGIFFRMALPLAAPALATVTIFSFLGNWDEYVWALTAIDDPLKRTLPVAIYSFQGQHGTEWGLVFAAMIIALIPVVIVFLLMQKHFTSGLTTGAFKG
jgi:multiple sugar transport system permease protein